MKSLHCLSVWEKRELVDALLYLVFTVHSFYRRARLINAGLKENPTVALVDSQSVHNDFTECSHTQGKSTWFDDKKIAVIAKLLYFSWKNIRDWKWKFRKKLRRLSKNYEYTMSSAETMVKISHLHTLLKRLWTRFLSFIFYLPSTPYRLVSW